MELILRAQTSNGSRHRDVIVDIEASHTVAELVATLTTQLDLGADSDTTTLTLLRTGTTLEATSTVGDSGIVSGDEVVIGRRRIAPVPKVPDRAISGDVLAGPDSGSSTTLLPGRHSVGRSNSTDMKLTDPTVSRRQLDVEVGAGGIVTIVPHHNVSNPVTVNDIEVDTPTTVTEDDVIGVGGTRLAFRPFARAEVERLDQLGQIEFHRTPYRPPVVLERAAPAIPKVPERREARKFQLLTALAPLAAGLTFFAFSRQPQFLIITMVSPIVMVANGIEDRRSGRRKFAAETVEFRERLIGWRDAIDALLDRERIDQLRTAPDLADLARRAEHRTVDLWARGRDAPDFLRIRVGLGSTAPTVRPVVGDQGDDDLLTEARDALVGTETIADVPVCVDLHGNGVLGVHGPSELIDGVAASVVIQAATLHSPEDLTISAAVSADRPLASWLKWLPHVRALSSPLAGEHIVTDEEQAGQLIGRLLEAAEYRTEASAETRRDVQHRPWMLVVLDTSLHPDPADVARLLDLCPRAGISVLWLATKAADVPRQAADVLAVAHGPSASAVGRLWSTDPSVADRAVEVEQVRLDIADRIARSLAPIRDASTASLASSIPRVAPLLDVLGVGAPTAGWVTEKWLTPSGYGLPFQIGMGADGPLVLDLVEDGPHTLIGGTSGAGKSELMQSIVASLAVNHSPERLNFLFVDYKGGASSNVFGVLPHTVGYVTNLSAELSLRALTSLRAELNRRMQVMEGKAKDLAEMIELHPDDAPASLVIVVDEFATLVKEVPEFVAGIVDIAQRGRSLGIHLILATQRPSGSVNENILANTNLRMSLRMLDRSESQSVIGSDEAADIPVPLKGRAYARLGPRKLVAFQSAFCGAPLTTEQLETPVLVAPFDRTTDSPKAVAGAQSNDGFIGTHLDAVLVAVITAAQNLALPEPRKPWRDVLPDVVALADVIDDPRSSIAHRLPGRVIPMGMIDVPDLQDQAPALIDLEEGGGWLIFGSGGSGKTTVLRTLAMAAAMTGRPDQVEIFGLDFASRGLASILPLPHVVDVASGDDLEAVTRHIATLSAELSRRRELLASVHAEHLTAYNERHDAMSRIVVLIDGFGGFAAQFTGGGAGSMGMAIPMDRWADMLHDLCVEGRQVGIHVVITADRRNAVPSRLHSSISNRLVLRHADEQGYGEHGIPATRARSLDLAAGRGLWQADAIAQIASVSVDPVGKAQGDSIAQFARSFVAGPPSRLATDSLPDVLSYDALAGAVRGALLVPLGRTDRTGEPAMIDLTWSHVLVAGAGRSGRSSTLSTVAHGLAGAHRLWAIGSASSAMDRTLFDDAAFGRGDDIGPLVDRLENLIGMGDDGRPHVLFVDDIDMFDDMMLATAFDKLAKMDVLRVVASVETRSLSGYTTNPLLTSLKRARRLLVLQPDDANEVVQATGVKSPVRPGMRSVPGRGVLVADREPVVVQVALTVVSQRSGHDDSGRDDSGRDDSGRIEQPEVVGPHDARVDDVFDQALSTVAGQ